ncbi:MAG: ribosome-associated translation inhibitor RaiA [Elusimicrobia bacterium]|nr:ribosome-associated translation inhibitor RaiA [Elusimicrobiota bacterium]
MEIHLTAKHLKITPAIRDYVSQKLEKAQRYFDHIVWGQVFLYIEKRTHNAEILIHAPGQTFRALASAADLYSAVDLASDKVDSQLKKYKERLKGRYKAASIVAVPDGAALAGPLQFSVIKQQVSPMTPQEALQEMESLGQSFRIYQDKDSRQIQVLFRREDDSYGIVQPIKKGGR